MISYHDQQILLSLASKQLEIANSSKMTDLKKLWLLHNSYNGTRPMIRVETDTFASDILPSMLNCKGETARNIEYSLLLKQINHTVFNDDSIVEPYFPIRNRVFMKPFNLDIHTTKSSDSGSIGHHFEEYIKDLGDDFNKLEKSTFHFDEKNQNDYKNLINDAIGKILPAKVVGGCLYSCPTQDVVHIMSMETMLFSMMDYPDLFKNMMQNLTNDYIDFYRFQEDKNLILPTTDCEFLGQGSYAFTKELKNNLPHYNSNNVWGFMDSQETVGISPEMFDEFIAPYYLQLSKQYGLLSYGCCEPVDQHWQSISKFKNLRKVSISPWCNEQFMAEKLADSGIIYHRKPSASFLGVGDDFDENEFREYIRRTITLAKNCKIEFTQRDVYTVHKNIEKVKKYVRIIREESENAYK